MRMKKEVVLKRVSINGVAADFWSSFFKQEVYENGKLISVSEPYGILEIYGVDSNNIKKITGIDTEEKSYRVELKVIKSIDSTGSIGTSYRFDDCKMVEI